MENKLTIHTIRSSSKGNASIICSQENKILVDCGISGKTLEESLCELNVDASSLNAVLITHEHTDHIRGVGIVSRKYNLPIYANEATWRAMGKSLGRIDDRNVKVFRTGEAFSIGSVKVKAFDIPHDAAEPVGYTFESRNEKVAVATDMGEISKIVLNATEGCEEVLLEANYDLSMLEIGPYPYELKRRIKGRLGHLCNDDAAQLACSLAENGTRKIVLGHISWDNNHPDLAFYTVRNALLERGFITGSDIDLTVALREGCGAVQPSVVPVVKKAACG